VAVPDVAAVAPEVDVPDVSATAAPENLTAGGAELPEGLAVVASIAPAMPIAKVPEPEIPALSGALPDATADASLPSAPEVSVPEAAIPTPEGLPTVDASLPTVDVTAPAVDVSAPAADVAVPDVGAVKVPSDLEVPDVSAPAVDITAPTVDIKPPAVEGLEAPSDLDAPGMGAGELPISGAEVPGADVKGPAADVAAFSLPEGPLLRSLALHSQIVE
jgi:hypothetical protein